MNYELRIMNKSKVNEKKDSSHDSCFMIRDSATPFRRGFTLIELMVSIGIFLVISSIVMVNQRSFGGNMQISNLAYDVALGIRQAQVYGTGMKKNIAGTYKGYGIHFSHQGYFILFADIDNNGEYDRNANIGPDPNTPNSRASCNPNSECVTVFQVEQGNIISKFCAGSNCTDVVTPSKNLKLNRLDIIFLRPDPSPFIVGYDANDDRVETPTASITVTSPQGVSKNVNVLSSGQISVQQ